MRGCSAVKKRPLSLSLPPLSPFLPLFPSSPSLPLSLLSLSLSVRARMRVCYNRKNAENSWKMFFSLQAVTLKATIESIVVFSRVRDNYRFARTLDKQDCRSQIPFLFKLLPALSERLLESRWSEKMKGKPKCTRD